MLDQGAAPTAGQDEVPFGKYSGPRFVDGEEIKISASPTSRRRSSSKARSLRYPRQAQFVQNTKDTARGKATALLRRCPRKMMRVDILATRWAQRSARPERIPSKLLAARLSPDGVTVSGDRAATRREPRKLVNVVARRRMAGDGTDRHYPRAIFREGLRNITREPTAVRRSRRLPRAPSRSEKARGRSRKEIAQVRTISANNDPRSAALPTRSSRSAATA